MYYQRTNSSAMALISMSAWVILVLSGIQLYFMIFQEKDLLKSLIGIEQIRSNGESVMTGMIKFYGLLFVISAAIAFQRGIIVLLAIILVVSAVSQYGKAYTFRNVQGFNLNSLPSIHGGSARPAPQRAAVAPQRPAQPKPATGSRLYAGTAQQKKLWDAWVQRNGWIVGRQLNAGELKWCDSAEAKKRTDALRKVRCFTGRLSKPKNN